MNKFFQQLKKDHKEVQEMIEQLSEMKSSASSKRAELFKKLKMELMPHMKAEETAFYHPLEDKKGTRELAFEGEEEHHVTEFVLRELEESESDKDHWTAKLKVLKDLIEHHVEEEEGEIFESAEKVIKDNEFESIMSQFEKEKERIKKSMM